MFGEMRQKAIQVIEVVLRYFCGSNLSYQLHVYLNTIEDLLHHNFFLFRKAAKNRALNIKTPHSFQSA